MSNELPPGLGRSAGIPELRRLTAGQLHDPRYVLGLHDVDGISRRFRIALPHAVSAEISGSGIKLKRLPNTFVFEATAGASDLKHPVRTRWIAEDGSRHSATDPYGFAASLTSEEISEFNNGRHTRAQRMLGSHPATFDGISGMRFSVWAPNAERVSVVGNFNRWDGRCHAMFCHGSSGIWELFIPELGVGEHYKYEIRNGATGKIYLKSDPFARQYEMRPATASITSPNSKYHWRDADWISARRTLQWPREPISVYELHLGSWQRDEHGGFLNYRELAARLAPYLNGLKFTHVELLPITEHPFDDSWGYQTTGFFAPTSRFGSHDDFRAFVDVMHENGIGVILDWVPGHFPKDDHALANFDGTKLFEYEDPRKGEHPDWQTLIFNYARSEVTSFLVSSALHWLEEFHIDALRVDAVASMLYLDYSRVTGQWMPNIHGGNENLEAIRFLKELNEVTHRECPGTITIAEESTAWPKVSRPTYEGGLGFSFKWNMGWMHDTLKYFKRDSIHRRYHHDELTFGPMYAFTENFLLPLSHDEVVHGKGSLLNRMPGDHWQRFANLRLLLTFQWTYPGKKLLFMGSEFGQNTEWNHHEQLPWHLLERREHAEISQLIADLNSTYRARSELQIDCEADGFYWLSWQDDDNSVLSFGRTNGSGHLLIVLNCTPTPHEDYRIGAPLPGVYREILNSDAAVYGGSNYGNGGELVAAKEAFMGQPHSLSLHLPPLAGIVLTHVSNQST